MDPAHGCTVLFPAAGITSGMPWAELEQPSVFDFSLPSKKKKKGILDLNFVTIGLKNMRLRNLWHGVTPTTMP